MNLKTGTILVLSPHTDDGELGMGGTISNLKNPNTHYIGFSTGSANEAEARKALKEIGIKPENTQFLDFETRHMERDRQEILDAMVLMKEIYEPDTVFIPCRQDSHQDHTTVAAEAFRAFKTCNILAYELPWNNPSFAPTYFHGISRRDLDAKCRALAKYRSQRTRPYMAKEFTRSHATFRGVTVGYEFAEAFEIVRIIG